MTMPAPAANPCTFCGEGESILSVMKLDDYSQEKACPFCAPMALRTIADGIEQALREAGLAETVEGIAGLAAEQPSAASPADRPAPHPPPGAAEAPRRKPRAKPQEREP